MKKTVNSKKKVIISVMMAALLFVAGALAYMIYTSGKTNSFTAGDVGIELWESFDSDRNGTITGLSYNSDGTIKTTEAEDEVYGPDEEYISSPDISEGESVQKQPFLVSTGNTSEYVYMWVGIPQLDKDMYFLNDEDIELFDIYHYKRDSEGNIVYDTDGNPTILDGVNEGWILIDDCVPENCMDLGTTSNWYDYSGTGIDIAAASNIFAESPYNYTTAAEYHYYLYAYDKTLNPGEETPPVFDVVKVIDDITEDMVYYVVGYSPTEGGLIRNIDTNIAEAKSKGYTSTAYTLEYVYDDEIKIYKDTTWGNISRPILLNSYAIQAQIDELETPAYDDDGNEIPLYKRAWSLYSSQDAGSYPSDVEIVVHVDDEEPIYVSDGTVFELPELPENSTYWSYYTGDTVTTDEDGTVLAKYGYLEPGDIITLNQHEENGKKYVTNYYFNSTNHANSDEIIITITKADGSYEIKHLTGSDSYVLPDTGSDEFTTWNMKDVTVDPLDYSYNTIFDTSVSDDGKNVADLAYGYNFVPLSEGTSIYKGLKATYLNSLGNKKTATISYGHVYQISLCEDTPTPNQPVYQFVYKNGNNYYINEITPVIGNTITVPNLPDTSANCWIRVISSSSTSGYLDTNGNSATSTTAQILHPGDVITVPDSNTTFAYLAYTE